MLNAWLCAWAGTAIATMQTLDPSAATRSRFFIRKPPSSPHLFAVLIGGKASERRKTVMSSARNFYVIGVTGDPETVGIMEQPRERIDIRCLEGAAEPARRSGRIGNDRSEERRVGKEWVSTGRTR